MIEVKVRDKASLCPRCNGSGSRWSDDLCPDCEGKGRIFTERWVSIDHLHNLLCQVGTDEVFEPYNQWAARIVGRAADAMARGRTKE